MATAFKKGSKTVAGMVHVGALPGTPAARHSLDEIIATAISESQFYRDAGFDAVIVENMHDRPYLRRDAVGPEITAAMAVITREVKAACGLTVGVQILAAANRQAMAAARAGGADFVRAEGFVFGHVADEGWIDSDAGDLLRYRKAIGAENVRVFTDIKKKHSAHAVTADVSLGETARAAQFFGSDGLIVSGAATGEATAPEDLRAVAGASPESVLIVGSGVTAATVAQQLSLADAVIVGSDIKRDGRWENAIDADRLAAFIRAAR